MSKLAHNLYAATGWTPEDVIQEAENRGKMMTREQAIELLETWSENIVQQMNERGWDVISTAITRDYPKLPLLPGLLGKDEGRKELANPTVVLRFNPEGTQGEYEWTCPLCKHNQPEWPDDPEPLNQVLCGNCGGWFDYVKES